MIRFALKCNHGHDFESWFQSGAAYDALHKAGHVMCPTCGTHRVEKSLMTPRVALSPGTAPPSPSPAAPAAADAPGTRAQAIARLRTEIEANSEYVGMNFVAEARKMHSGEATERAIYGEARPDEAKKLIEEGVPVTPLPFMPRRKVN